MAITYYEDKRAFKLDTAGSSYVIRIADGNFLIHSYYGARVSDPVHLTDERGKHGVFYPNPPGMTGFFSPDLAPMEYGTNGCGDMRVCALSVLNSDGNTATDIRYVSHKIYPGKEPIPGMPSLYLNDTTEAETLEITALDETTGARAILYYTVFEALSVITRRVRVVNDSEKAFRLRDVKSACVELPDCDFDLLHLWGAWNKERTYERTRLFHGIQTVSSARGVSGHAHNPFVGLARAGATEETGEVYGFNLVYSGEFSAHSEVDGFETTRLVMGISETHFEWEVKPHDFFDAPELVMVYSASGIGGMSRTFHRLYNQHLISPRWREKKRPLLINSWEAAGFAINEAVLLDFAHRASELGVEMLVIDDGWFGRRNDSASSLGDWTVNREKLPNGLSHLIGELHKINMKCGIWFEPEMVSPDSDLYRAHPDWCIRVPNREPCLSRNQLILDMSRPEVRDCIWAQMKTILTENEIDYVKWDFNRNFTDIGSAALDSAHQGEVLHRFILGTYELMNRLVTEFPAVLFESCSGGGGRFDPAMLYYSPQIWTSDNCDPIERLYIQFGTSLCYPASTMSAHVSASPRAGVATKGLVSAWGCHGYELDPNRFSAEEKEIVKEQVADYHRFYKLTHEGDLYRLVLPTEDKRYCAWELVSENQSEALVTVINISLRPFCSRVVRPRGLDPNKRYVCKTAFDLYDGVIFSGDTWMNAGLNLTSAEHADGTGYRFYFEEVGE